MRVVSKRELIASEGIDAARKRAHPTWTVLVLLTARPAAQTNTFLSSDNVGIEKLHRVRYFMEGAMHKRTSLILMSLALMVTGAVAQFPVTGVPATTAQGAYLGWNGLTGGTGETDFINNEGLGSGGFAFMNTPNSGSPRTTLTFIDGAGNISTGGGTGGDIISYRNDSVGPYIGSYYSAPLRLGTAYSEKMRISPAGNVGIGTTSPGAALEVNGNVKLTSGSGASITFADGTTQSTAWTGTVCGGDFAESVDVTGNRHHYEPGDLLVIDPKHPGKFLEAAKPYSTLVAGIYSTKPGYVGRRLAGPQNPDEVPMAMVGIVPTKVTAENGPIHTGDLLVASSTPGRAMKGTDRNRLTGAVVGKALGDLESGSGTIEALVTLQ